MGLHETQERKSEAIEELLCNRTGIMNNPELSAELIEGAKNTIPSSRGNGELAASRADYLNEALPIGSPPLSCLEVREAGQVDEGSLALDSEGMVVLLDKLGERLAFERSGTRLYQAFLQKFETLAEDDELGPTSGEIQHICDEELEHFKLLQKAIVKRGGDATVQSPSADVAGVLSHGALQIISDPRTTVPQSLQAILSAELADNDGWELLRQVAAQVGDRDLEKQCQKAYEIEQEHLEKVRGWLMEMTIEEAGGIVAEEMDTEEQKAQPERPRKKSSPKKRSSPKGNNRRKRK